MKKNHLPNHLFETITKWHQRARKSEEMKGKPPTYKTVIQQMKRAYGREVGAPSKQTLDLPGGLPPVQVYRNQFLPQALSMLRDPTLMKDPLWQFNAYPMTCENDDIFPSAPRCPGYTHRRYGPLNSSEFWRRAEQSVRDSVRALPQEQQFKGRNILVPVILFDDSTLCDNIGRLVSQPVLFTLGNLSDKTRRSPKSYSILGMIPSYPKSSKERESDRNSVTTKLEYLKFYHECLDYILEEVHQLENLPGGTPACLPMLGKVHLHFRLAFIIGDTKGHNDMCCHYNAMSTSLHRMSRDCNIPQCFADQPSYPCQPVHAREIYKTIKGSIDDITARNHVQDARARCRTISQHLMLPTYHKFSFGGMKSGVFGGTPYELLHLYYSGIMKYELSALYNTVDIPKNLLAWFKKRMSRPLIDSMSSRPSVPDASKLKVVFNKVEFERRIRIVTRSSRRQSDRNMPRSPFKNGVSDLTKLTGQEYPGLILMTLCCMKGMLPPDQEPLERKFSLLLFLSLSLLNWLTMPSYSEKDLTMLHNRITVFLQFYVETVGPIRECQSKSGLRITKLHCLKHFPDYIRQYGNTYNFFGGFCEALLKDMVKKPSKNTCRRQDRLDLDLLNRDHERRICDVAEKDLINTGWLPTPQGSQIPNQEVGRRHIMPTSERFIFSTPAFYVCRDGVSWRTFSANMKQLSQEAIYPDLPGNQGNQRVLRVIEHVESLNSEDPLDRIAFCYSCRVPSSNPSNHDILRCHPSYHSYPWSRRPWNDWAMVSWTRSVAQEDRRYSCAARILLWAYAFPSTSCPFDRQQTSVDRMFGVVQSLSSWTPRHDRTCPFFQFDTLEDELRVVQVDTVESVAYVLPQA